MYDGFNNIMLLSPWRTGSIKHEVISYDRYDCPYDFVSDFHVFDENQTGTIGIDARSWVV